MAQTTLTQSTVQFREAITLAAENRPSEALVAFRELVEHWPGDELADDALYNVGACFLSMNQFQHAADTFERLIRDYPDATIATHENSGRESGRTAAKAWLGLLSARLGVGDLDGARTACQELADFPDSKIHPAPGVERTFHDVGASLLLAAEGHAEDSADEVSPNDVQEGGEDASE